MKWLLITFFMLVLTQTGNTKSINIDSCGIDQADKLNRWEEQYFKESLPEMRQYTLHNKSFAFAYGNFGSTVISKKEYFDMWGREYHRLNQQVANTLILLTVQEKEDSGGFDYIIISWAKIHPTGKSRKKLIERVRRNSGKQPFG